MLQKIYARQILNRLINWIEENDILTQFQAGFRTKIGTVDQVFRFLCLVWKYIMIRKGHLCIAFVDLKAAFDLVPRNLLWKPLLERGVPGTILLQIIRLHQDNWAKVRWGPQGKLTDKIEVKRGVREGCVLAPTLFSLYVNDIPDHLLGCEHDSPRLGGLSVPALLFADDTILISQTLKGLQNLINSFVGYCKLKGLELNPSKTKYMSINPHKTFKENITVDMETIEFVYDFNYLGITLDSKLSWKPQLEKSRTILLQSTFPLIKNMESNTSKVVSPVLEVYKYKAQSASLHGVELWGPLLKKLLRLTKTSLLEKFYQFPHEHP